MTKPLFANIGALIALLLALIGAIYSYGQLTERVEMQSKQIEMLTTKMDALSTDFNGTRLEMMRLLSAHLNEIRNTRQR